jgi:UDP-N-acetylmuramate dehydrogenase
VRIETQIELGPLTTLGVGGRAAHYARVESNVDLCAALEWASARRLEVRVLGGGSNIVVADAEFLGLVIEVALRGVAIRESGAKVLVRAAAGEPWDEFVTAMVSRGYQGLECLSGIPGRVGATPIQNVGAYGQDVSETISEVKTLDAALRTERVFAAAECRFSYRDSFFKSIEPGRFIVTEVCFQLTPQGAPVIRYPELERWLSAHGRAGALGKNDAPSLARVRDGILHLRREKSMVLDAGDPNSRSCGSFFVNPLLTPAEFASFQARTLGEAFVPQFPQADGRIKLAAGWLIEHAGFPRGTRDGAVGLSTRHALALVAHDGARAADIRRLAERVQRGVYRRFGVRLEPEPVFWGS